MSRRSEASNKAFSSFLPLTLLQLRFILGLEVNLNCKTEASEIDFVIWHDAKSHGRSFLRWYILLQTHNAGDSFQFQCQHGPTECQVAGAPRVMAANQRAWSCPMRDPPWPRCDQGNMYHACAVAYIEVEEDLMEYVKCMINDNYDPARAALRWGWRGQWSHCFIFLFQV